MPTATRISPHRSLALAAVIVAAGAAWGWFGQVGDQVFLLRWLTGLGAPWLLVAFAAGALVRDSRAALVAGAAVTVVGIGAYYASMVAIVGPDTLRYAARIGLAWGFVGVLAGALFGWAGAVWRGGHGGAAAIAAAVPFAVLAGEVLALSGEWFSPGARLALTLELTAAGVLLAALVPKDRRFAITVGAAVVLALILGMAEADVRETLRAAGWSGA